MKGNIEKEEERAGRHSPPLSKAPSSVEARRVIPYPVNVSSETHLSPSFIAFFFFSSVHLTLKFKL
jgi:hypothetical protein